MLHRELHLAALEVNINEFATPRVPWCNQQEPSNRLHVNYAF